MASLYFLMSTDILDFSLRRPSGTYDVLSSFRSLYTLGRSFPPGIVRKRFRMSPFSRSAVLRRSSGCME